MILVNGQETDNIPISDRAFQYGDGCFTTLLITYGKVNAWAYHLIRLKDNVAALYLDGVDWLALTRWVDKIACQLQGQEKAVMKVIISRGAGGRGYSPAGCSSPNVVISTHDYPTHYDVLKKRGMNLILLERPIGLSSFAGIKHLNRLEQVLFKHEIEARDADEGVACDFNGYLVEACASNLFWRKGNVLSTPNISLSGVVGTMRAQVIKAAKKENYDVRFVSQKPSVLWDADEMFITNAVLQLGSVRRLETKLFTSVEACNAISQRLEA